MGNPFLFADRFSGAVVHLTAGGRTGRRTALHYFFANREFQLEII
jgi:hypothetical protein